MAFVAIQRRQPDDVNVEDLRVPSTQPNCLLCSSNDYRSVCVRHYWWWRQNVYGEPETKPANVLCLRIDVPQGDALFATMAYASGVSKLII